MEFYKGLVRLKQGRFDEAIDRIQAAIGAGLGSREAHAHYLLADACLGTGRFDEALSCVDRALQSAYPDWFRGRMIRIRIGALHGQGRRGEARPRRALGPTSARPTARRSRACSPRSASRSSPVRSSARTTPPGAKAGSTCAPTASAATTTSASSTRRSAWLDRAVENREWWMLQFLRSDVLLRATFEAIPASSARWRRWRSSRRRARRRSRWRRERIVGRDPDSCRQISGKCQGAPRPSSVQRDSCRGSGAVRSPSPSGFASPRVRSPTRGRVVSCNGAASGRTWFRLPSTGATVPHRPSRLGRRPARSKREPARSSAGRAAGRAPCLPPSTAAPAPPPRSPRGAGRPARSRPVPARSSVGAATTMARQRRHPP